MNAKSKKIIFDTSHFYHICTRTVEKIKIFNKEEDCFRFIFQMHAANVGKPAFNLYRNNIIKAAKDILNGRKITDNIIIQEHKPLVNIASFALVNEHLHLLLNPRNKDSIPKYMQKLKLGFAKYFNLKHKRNGNLFTRPYKIVPVESQFQLVAVLFYINTKNPLDVWNPLWKKEGIKDWSEALRFIEDYKFSSFPDLFMGRNNSLMMDRGQLERWVGGEIALSKDELVQTIKNYLSNKMKPTQDLFIE